MAFDTLPDDVAEALGRAEPQLGSFARLRYQSEVASTNDLALALALAGEPEGTSVLADRQTSGRGRRGREWFSPADAGLYLSIVMRPRHASRSLSLLTLGAGVAVAAAIERACGLPVELKWPNDVMIGRPWRKLGGVLSEAASAGDRVEAVVVGIGINLRQVRYPRAIADRATAIETELGRPIDRAPLVIELLGRMRQAIGWLHAGDTEAVRQAWRRPGAAGLAGSAVRWQQGAATVRGRARDIDADGALLVDVGGRVERIVSGEVLWESLGGV
jgi:BirA family biotin operon repressor/biotin-[acetyl-CoA-carboxylase] ligase